MSRSSRRGCRGSPPGSAGSSRSTALDPTSRSSAGVGGAPSARQAWRRGGNPAPRPSSCRHGSETRLTHLRLERPGRRRGPPGPRQPRPAQRDVGPDDRLLGGARSTSWPPTASVRVVVVTGEGTAFCSGGNTVAGSPASRTPTVDDLRTRMMPFYRAWLSIRRLEVPTIAAVNGPAIGAGLCLALACDIRYAAAGREARASRSSSSGCTPGWPATYLLPDVVGEAHARDLLLTGRMVDADEALRLGLVSRVHRRRRASTTEVLRDAAGIAATAPIAEPAHQARAARRRPRGTSSAACSGRRWPSRSRWPPRTCRRASAPPARSGRRSSPAADARRRDAGNGEEAPGLHSRRLPSPCERGGARRRGRGPHLRANLGGRSGAGQCGRPHRLWINLWTTLWTERRLRWTRRRGTACGGHARAWPTAPLTRQE